MIRPADKARRENAQKSTGPRSAAGKKRSSQNALSHGLSIPLHLDPAENARIQSLAGVINEKADDLTFVGLAEQIAEAQLEILRVRKLRQQLLMDSVSLKGTVADKHIEEFLRAAKTQEAVEGSINPSNKKIVTQSNFNLVEKITHIADQLFRLDRYEQRALSRRKFLIREYDAIKRLRSE